jgi:hypothetical protein
MCITCRLKIQLSENSSNFTGKPQAMNVTTTMPDKEKNNANRLTHVKHRMYNLNYLQPTPIVPAYQLQLTKNEIRLHADVTADDQNQSHHVIYDRLLTSSRTVSTPSWHTYRKLSSEITEAVHGLTTYKLRDVAHQVHVSLHTTSMDHSKIYSVAVAGFRRRSAVFDRWVYRWQPIV